jgi:LEA14-like dessication related protein
LAIEGVAFDLELNGQPFAKGVGRGGIAVPPFGEGVVDAVAITTLGGFVRQLGELKAGEPALRYRLRGTITLQDRTGGVPFEMDGDGLSPFRRGDAASQ